MTDWTDLDSPLATQATSSAWAAYVSHSGRSGQRASYGLTRVGLGKGVKQPRLNLAFAMRRTCGYGRREMLDICLKTACLWTWASMADALLPCFQRYKQSG